MARSTGNDVLVEVGAKVDVNSASGVAVAGRTLVVSGCISVGWASVTVATAGGMSVSWVAVNCVIEPVARTLVIVGGAVTVALSRSPVSEAVGVTNRVGLVIVAARSVG